MIEMQPSEYKDQYEADIDDMNNKENFQGSTIGDYPAALSIKDILHRAEALLFVSCEPMDVKEVAKLIGVSMPVMQEVLDKLCAEYKDRGMQLQKIAGGYQFMTRDEYAPLIEKLYHPKVQQLSAAALEALAIIAYKQPITRAEVAAVRQVDSDGVINTLLEKNLIREVGRVNSAGRPILYGTGREFLSFFGINSLDELPALAQQPSLIDEDFIL